MDLAGLTLTTRDAAGLGGVLAASADAEPLAPHTPLLRDARAPAGAQVHQDGWRMLDVTRAVPDGDLEAARDHVLSWGVLRDVGIGVTADRDRVEVGATVVQRLPARGPGVLAPCRVVDVVDEPDAAGFLYAALPGHPLAGEEAFVVTRDPSGVVTCRVTSRSRPAAAAATGLLPLVRAFQHVAARRYVASLAAAAAG